jgi:KUP system potassium uptake protein
MFALVYFAIELGFFGANIIKFFEGGWITVVLGRFCGGMYVRLV